MLGLGYRGSCRAWLKQLEILTVPSLFTYSLAVFVICSSSCFHTSFFCTFYTYKAEKSSSKQMVKFTSVQGGIIYSAIKVTKFCQQT
jgi:hypothetical protein